MKTRNAILAFLIKFGTVNCANLSPEYPAQVVQSMLSVMVFEGEIEVVGAEYLRQKCTQYRMCGLLDSSLNGPRIPYITKI